MRKEIVDTKNKVANMNMDEQLQVISEMDTLVIAYNLLGRIINFITVFNRGSKRGADHE